MSPSDPTSVAPVPLLRGFPPIRRAEYGGQTVVCLPDIVVFLLQRHDGEAQWSRLKHQLGKHRALADCFDGGVVCLPFTGSEGQSVLLDAAELSLALRIAAHIASPRVTQLFEHLVEVAGARRSGGHSLRERFGREGRSPAWIELRAEKAKAYALLKNEWSRRGVPSAQFKHLVNVISSEAMGVTVSQHRKLKELDNDAEVLDHCTKVELSLRLIGDQLTRQIAVARNAYGTKENEDAAREAGRIAGRFRGDIEAALGKPLLSRLRFGRRSYIQTKLSLA
jgi:hypothetical protein